MLSRAIGNILRNAAIHAGPNPMVAVHAVETPDSIRITITDDVPGVPEPELPRIFKSFYRVDRSRSRDTGGIGLGLAIVRSSIESCGGEVSVAIPENGGFSITLKLPKNYDQHSS